MCEPEVKLEKRYLHGHSGDWFCPNCKDVYYKCSRCDEDWAWNNADNDKGLECNVCGKYFCIACWQSTGALMVDLSNQSEHYCCEACGGVDAMNESAGISTRTRSKPPAQKSNKK